MTTHRQSTPHSTLVPPPRPLGLPQRPKFVPLPMQRKPNTICRNYIFWGSCGDWHCNRAHVPHHLMVDLFMYLLEQDDCPLELRSLRGRFARPKPGLSRRVHPSDRICAEFVERDGVCEQNRCPFAHLRRMQVYNSLLPFAKPSVTSVVPLVPEADENIVVKLPEMTNNMAREPPTINIINMNDQSSTISFPGCEPTFTASNVLEPHLSPVVELFYEYTVCLPKGAEPQQSSAAGSCVAER